MSSERTERPFQLLKKSQIIRVLNISAKEFERKLSDGMMPQPFLWVSQNPKGRRWHPTAIRQAFGIDFDVSTALQES